MLCKASVRSVLRSGSALCVDVAQIGAALSQEHFIRRSTPLNSWHLLWLLRAAQGSLAKTALPKDRRVTSVFSPANVDASCASDDFCQRLLLAKRSEFNCKCRSLCRQHVSIPWALNFVVRVPIKADNVESSAYIGLICDSGLLYRNGGRSSWIL